MNQTKKNWYFADTRKERNYSPSPESVHQEVNSGYINNAFGNYEIDSDGQLTMRS